MSGSIEFIKIKFSIFLSDSNNYTKVLLISPKIDACNIKINYFPIPLHFCDHNYDKFFIVDDCQVSKDRNRLLNKSFKIDSKSIWQLFFGGQFVFFRHLSSFEKFSGLFGRKLSSNLFCSPNRWHFRTFIQTENPSCKTRSVQNKMILYHCLSKSAMYKQEKRLVQITLLEQPLPIKWEPQSIIYYLPWKFIFVTLNFCLQSSRNAKGF